MQPQQQVAAPQQLWFRPMPMIPTPSSASLLDASPQGPHPQAIQQAIADVLARPSQVCLPVIGINVLFRQNPQH